MKPYGEWTLCISGPLDKDVVNGNRFSSISTRLLLESRQLLAQIRQTEVFRRFSPTSLPSGNPIFIRKLEPKRDICQLWRESCLLS